MNNKGFSLVEIITVVALLGLLTSVSLIAVNGYLQDSRKKVYDSIEENAYDAAASYIINNPGFTKVITTCDISTSDYNDRYDVDRLIRNGSTTVLHIDISCLEKLDFLEPPMDPTTKNTKCSGEVLVSENTTTSVGNEVKNYSYNVHIKCKGYESPINNIYPRKSD